MIFQVYTVILVEYELFEVKYDIDTHCHLDEEGEQASNGGVVRVTLLVKVEVDGVSEHVICFYVFFEFAWHCN